jgi:hypothetical protein
MFPKPCFTLLAACLVLPAAGCATTAPAVPKACDGHHRRPANPNGSVLESTESAPPRTTVFPPGGPAAIDANRPTAQAPTSVSGLICR